MAWYEGTIANAAGAIKTVLDEKLPLNSKWHIEDNNAGTGIGVYHCLDAVANVDFIVVAKDNQVDYCTMELWQGWDSVNHVGTGQSVTVRYGTANTPRIVKTAGAYGISVRDHRFVWCNLSVADYIGSYFGGLVRLDTTKQFPILWTNCSLGGLTTNWLGSTAGHSTTGNYCAASVLFNGVGNVDPVMFWLTYGSNPLSRVMKTTNNKMIVLESGVKSYYEGLYLGQMDGVMIVGATLNGMTPGQTVSYEGVDWIVLAAGTSCCLVRKS